MGIFKNWIHILSGKTKAERKNKARIPNGWGRQSYQGSIQKAEYNEQLDLNNIRQKRGWIQAFVAERLQGIQKHKRRKRLFYPYHSLTFKAKP